MSTLTTSARQHLLLRPSFSSTTTNRIKLAPLIDTAVIVSFEKRKDQKVRYIIQVHPQQHGFAKSYTVARKYEDFIQLSQNLHEKFNTRKHLENLPKIKTRLSILPTTKQLNMQRLEELNLFLKVLFERSSSISNSYIVLEFFAVQTSDLVYEKYSIPNCDIQPKLDHNVTTSKWKKLRSSKSFLSTSSSTALSTLCSQAASKIMNRNHQHPEAAPTIIEPSRSTPTNTLASTKSCRNLNFKKKQLKKSKSSICVGYESSINQSTCSSISQHTITSSTTIKIKVIYDADNIVVIQVPRSITLRELRFRIAQKFSDPIRGYDFENRVVLLYDDNKSSCCSVASNHFALPAILINKEQDLTQLMNTKWNRLEKVILRCVA